MSLIMTLKKYINCVLVICFMTICAIWLAIVERYRNVATGSETVNSIVNRKITDSTEAE